MNLNISIPVEQLPFILSRMNHVLVQAELDIILQEIEGVG